MTRESHWRTDLNPAFDLDPDDEEFETTPPDVVQTLGFDPYNPYYYEELP